jgi:hypothetical protein
VAPGRRRPPWLRACDLGGERGGGARDKEGDGGRRQGYLRHFHLALFLVFEPFECFN